MAGYIVGVDIGGTFTDCVVVDEQGTVTTAKTPSTPGDFAQGMIDAIALAADKLGCAVSEFYEQISLLAHGTTVGTNAVVQKRGAKIGLITTKGHRDVIHIMRGSRGLGGRDMRELVHFPESRKPTPIAPKRLIATVSERVDCLGNIVVPLNEQEAEAAIRDLTAQGVEAIAICFLWSFLRPDHERRVQDMVRRMAPDIFVTCSADLVPKWGEYERTTAVAINSYIGPLTAGYLRDLDRRLKSLGLRQPLQITQCGGGTISVETAMSAPILTLDSGPVSGVTGSAYLGKAMGHTNIITTDMGGTSFDVGVVHHGEPTYSFVSNVNQYEYFIPKVDIQAIGAGGGSLVRVDEATRTLRVGPDSAGAKPGPVCYRRGGSTPTVTDADVVLGFIDPERFAGGRMRLDKAAAAASIEALGQRIGMDVLECASGITKIVEFQMADLIRKMTVGKGLDPRDFVLYAFGGAGPLHAGVFARELGVQKVVVPQGGTASTWCAFGAAAAEILHIHERVDISASPLDAARVNRMLEDLEQIALRRFAAEGIPTSRQRLAFSIDIRHKGQINEVEVTLGAPRVTGDFEPMLRESFYRTYEALYGGGSALRAARLELVTFRLRARAQTPQPQIRSAQDRSDVIARDAVLPRRAIYWDEVKGKLDTAAYDGTRLRPGNSITGPAVVETPDTTVVARPGQRLSVDGFGNFELLVNSAGSGRQE
jgi:N-methylhydantoinase A